MTRTRNFSIVLAGGEGKRLYPLTRDRAKPAVPFGGQYRLVDFALSNLANAGFLRMAVLTQYKSHSLDRHISQSWRLSPLLGNYVTPVPAQMRRGPRWFSGSADAIFQNLNIIEDEGADYVIVLGADHIYRMDPGQMLRAHLESGASATVAGIRVPISEASAFGVIEADSSGRVAGFREKPADPQPHPEDPASVFASMGNYVFTADALMEAVTLDSADEGSAHDMGGNIIPSLVAAGECHVYDFTDNEVPGQTERERGYWRDVGTIDSYYTASMDLIAVEPIFNLYNRDWPVYSHQPPLPPAKTVHEEPDRAGLAFNSMLGSGVVVSGGTVRRSVLGRLVRVNSHVVVEDSVLFDGVRVGRGAVVRRAIIDKGVEVPDGFEIGVDPIADKERFTVSDGGVVVIGKNDKVG